MSKASPWRPLQVLGVTMEKLTQNLADSIKLFGTLESVEFQATLHQRDDGQYVLQGRIRKRAKSHAHSRHRG